MSTVIPPIPSTVPSPVCWHYLAFLVTVGEPWLAWKEQSVSDSHYRKSDFVQTVFKSLFCTLQ